MNRHRIDHFVNLLSAGMRGESRRAIPVFYGFNLLLMLVPMSFVLPFFDADQLANFMLILVPSAVFGEWIFCWWWTRRRKRGDVSVYVQTRSTPLAVQSTSTKWRLSTPRVDASQVYALVPLVLASFIFLYLGRLLALLLSVSQQALRLSIGVIEAGMAGCVMLLISTFIVKFSIIRRIPSKSLIHRYKIWGAFSAVSIMVLTATVVCGWMAGGEWWKFIVVRYILISWLYLAPISLSYIAGMILAASPMTHPRMAVIFTTSVFNSGGWIIAFGFWGDKPTWIFSGLALCLLMVLSTFFVLSYVMYAGRQYMLDAKVKPLYAKILAKIPFCADETHIEQTLVSMTDVHLSESTTPHEIIDDMIKCRLLVRQQADSRRLQLTSEGISIVVAQQNTPNIG